MEQVVDLGNMRSAHLRVVENRGAPGVDDVPVSELRGWLKRHWPSVKVALLEGRYAGASHMNPALPARYFAHMGLVSLLPELQRLQRVCRTAVCGTARPVV